MQTIDAFDREFPDETACRDFLVSMRWPDGVRCPRCDARQRIYKLKKPFTWTCCNPDCGGRKGYHFSVLTRTIFENTKIPLKLWFKVAYLILVSKKGISALQLHRTIFGEYSGSAYHTSWFMVMRWRAAMKGDAFPLTGEIEVDETFVGGKEKNKHRSKRQHLGTGGTGKVAVIGAIARKGMVVAQVVQNTDTATLDSFVRRVVDKEKVDLIASDEHTGYRLLKEGGLPHEVVTHSAGEYVRGIVHTNNIENFWSLLKRGIMGSYHHVSKAYLPLYMNEFSWRFNNRGNPNAFADLIQGVGK
jgi:transposase-like protein